MIYRATLYSILWGSESCVERVRRLQCRTYLDPEDIFKCEVDETHDKLLQALVGLNTFKETYEEHRRRLPDYRANSTTVNNSDSDAASPEDWEFPPQIIFHRYDRFLARLANIRVCNLLPEPLKLNPVYTIQTYNPLYTTRLDSGLVQQENVRAHDAASCQTGCTSGCTSDCIVCTQH